MSRIPLPFSLRNIAASRKQLDWMKFLPSYSLVKLKGDGWTVFITLWTDESINVSLPCASLPHKRNTMRIFFCALTFDKMPMVWSVNSFQPSLRCEFANPFSTERCVFSRNTPLAAHLERSPCSGHGRRNRRGFSLADVAGSFFSFVLKNLSMAP